MTKIIDPIDPAWNIRVRIEDRASKKPALVLLRSGNDGVIRWSYRPLESPMRLKEERRKVIQAAIELLNEALERH